MSSYTATSGVFFNDDGSCGVGVECFFEQGAPSKATQSWTFNKPINAVELWGDVAMRTSGAQADILVGIFIDGREIVGAILKAGGTESTVNLPVHESPEGLQTSPNPVVRVDMEAAGSGDAWNPMNCEVRLTGRWE